MLGPPGCGRVNYSNKIAESLKIGVVSSGALITRELQDNKFGFKERI